jgi:N-dimethylarginine dimethylaminohydrolase
MKQFLILFFLVSIGTMSAQISNPRAWAEYEETSGIILCQGFGWQIYNMQPNVPEWILSQIIEQDSIYIKLINEALSQNIDVYYILKSDPPNYDFNRAILDTMKNRYGIDTSNPKFHPIEVDINNYDLTRWTRDDGPMNVYKNKVDTLYNVLFADDMKGSGKIVSKYLGIPTHEISDPATSGLPSDGGNYLVDGNNIAIIDKGMNSPKAQLPKYASLFGLDHIYTVPSYMVHIDYFMKLVNEETLLVSEQLPSNYLEGYGTNTYKQDSASLIKAVSYIQQNVVSYYGRPLKIVRIPNAPTFNSTPINLTYLTADASYINSLIVNNAVFVPQYANPATDTVAIKIYKEVMPGYKIIPVNCIQLAKGSGAIHCITNSIATDEPVLIQHACMPDSVNWTSDYKINASILTRSGIKSATLFWTNDLKNPYQAVTMNHSSGDDYTAMIPGQPFGSRIHYYFEAEAKSGKKGRKPFVAPGWAYNFLVHPDGLNIGFTYLSSKDMISVYPNPTKDMIYFDVHEFSKGNCQIKVYDLWGKVVMNKKFSSFIEINTSTLSPGYYLYVITDSETGRFISDRFIRE